MGFPVTESEALKVSFRTTKSLLYGHQLSSCCYITASKYKTLLGLIYLDGGIGALRKNMKAFGVFCLFLCFYESTLGKPRFLPPVNLAHS